jgi:hypothetical protein
MPGSVAKFIRPRSFTAITAHRTQAVHTIAGMPAIGAQMFYCSHRLYLIICLIEINIFGTHSAVSCVRIYSPRFLT